MKALTFIEIDVPTFVEESPAATQTFRFTYPCDYLPRDIEAIPSMVAVSYSPATISLGKDLGSRASLDVTFQDHRHIFNGEAFTSGTFFGKWRARYGQTLQGMALRWIQGLEGQPLAEMDTRHFIIESTDGPTPQGGYRITAKDILKLADNDRAQAPLPSNGFIVAGIDDNDLSITLSPSGIGNSEYPASGYLALGGDECVSFTRSGDVCTIVRGQLNTTAVAHDAGVRAQLILRYFGEDPADIIHDLLTTYAGVDPDYIPLTSWQTETLNYLQQNYTAHIAEPTSVNKLVSELVEQAALAIWWEPLTQLIRLQVLRGIPTTTATFDEDNTLEGSLAVREQPNTRLSQVFVYFGLKTPLLPLDQENSFRSSALSVISTLEAGYQLPVIKKVFSRWIPFGARSVAVRLGDLQLGRFRDPPRRFNLELFRHGEESPTLGGGYRLKSWTIQDTTGASVAAPLQITRLNPLSDRYQIEAEEMLFVTLDPADLTDRVLIIDSSINDVNLREMHDSIYPEPSGSESPPVTLTVYIESEVIVGSSSPSSPALNVGDWPSGIDITVFVRGRIQGAGGVGGNGYFGDNNGGAGGVALYTRENIDLVLDEGAGEIWGGGGGGGGDEGPAGGGGAGQIPGAGGLSDIGGGDGSSGTTEAGGNGNDTLGLPFTAAGDGGGPGQDGQNFPAGGSGVGGAAGAAIDGLSFITKTGAGDIRGDEVN